MTRRNSTLGRGALGVLLAVAGCGRVLNVGSQDDSGVIGCRAACGSGCQEPKLVCYSDGQEHCSDCLALCVGATRVSCGSGDAGAEPDAGGTAQADAGVPADAGRDAGPTPAPDGGSDAGVHEQQFITAMCFDDFTANLCDFRFEDGGVVPNSTCGGLTMEPNCHCYHDLQGRAAQACGQDCRGLGGHKCVPLNCGSAYCSGGAICVGWGTCL